MDLDPEALSLPWRTAFELAWEAWGAGTFPIGAVVCDDAGQLVTRGRNRVFDSAPPPGQAAASWIAHAEVNALLQLPAGQHENFTILSTTEPCLMCAGAITMSLRGVVNIGYAAADPLAGGMSALAHSVQALRRNLRVHRLAQAGFTLFAEVLNVAESIRRVPDGFVAGYYRTERAGLFRSAVELGRVLEPISQVGGNLESALAASLPVLSDLGSDAGDR